MGDIKISWDKQEVLDFIYGKIYGLPEQFKSLIEGLKETYGIEISIYAPVGATSNLVSSHVFVDTGLYSWFVDNEMMYFPFVILGTEQHEICPLMPAFALYWPELGHPLPIGRCVTHPGTVPYDYMEWAFDAAEGDVDSQCDEMLSWLVDE